MTAKWGDDIKPLVQACRHLVVQWDALQEDTSDYAARYFVRSSLENLRRVENELFQKQLDIMSGPKR